MHLKEHERLEAAGDKSKQREGLVEKGDCVCECSEKMELSDVSSSYLPAKGM